MKRLIIVFSVFLTLHQALSAQNVIDSVLVQVERNNTTLSAMRKKIEADKTANLTGIYLQNPELEFNYLWGQPDIIGNRQDISIRQTFDFPTAYGYRKQVARTLNEQVDIGYQQHRKAILLETRLLCTDVIYTNVLIKEFEARIANARGIANAFKESFEKGAANILEYNKAQMNLLNLTKETDAIKIRQDAFIRQLVALNGGEQISISENAFQPVLLPEGFEQWYLNAEQSIPQLQWLEKEIQVSQHKEKLNRAMSLPKSSAGYMSENVVGQHFQGITFGISIPLWENKNTVKYIQTQTLALESMETDHKLQLYNQLKTQYNMALSLQKSVHDYRQALLLYDNSGLLKKALDNGEISLIDYLLELTYYYHTFDNMLSAENELNKAVVLLNQYQQ